MMLTWIFRRKRQQNFFDNLLKKQNFHISKHPMVKICYPKIVSWFAKHWLLLWDGAYFKSRHDQLSHETEFELTPVDFEWLSCKIMHNLARFLPESCKISIHSARNLQDSHFSARILQDNHFSARNLQDNHFSARILQNNHFSARILQDSNFSARILQDNHLSVRIL